MVVIGAGPAGLSACAEFLDAGVQIILIEAQRNLGGRAASYLHPESGEILDPGPHTILESNRHVLGLLARVGTRHLIKFAPSLKIRFVHPTKGSVNFHCPKLPVPYGFLWGVLTHKFLSFSDRLQAIHLGRFLASADDETPDISVAEWFDDRKVSRRARSFFWEPLIYATLNNDPGRISLKSLAQTFKMGLLAPGQKSGLGLPSADWGRLVTGNLPDQIRCRGGQVLTGTRVRKIWIEDGRAQGVILSENRRIPSDAVISALPPWNLAKLLPVVPKWLQPCLLFSWSPIVSLHWIHVDPLPVATPVAVLESPIQWIFSRPASSGDGKVVLSTVTGGEPCMSFLSGRKQGRQSATAEIASVVRDLFSTWHPGEEHRMVLRTIRRATITIGPGQSHLRAGPDTDVPGLWIAGDWTDTSLPPTLESAVLSGVRAARFAVEWLKSH